jgi:hypothetical protein
MSALGPVALASVSRGRYKLKLTVRKYGLSDSDGNLDSLALVTDHDDPYP